MRASMEIFPQIIIRRMPIQHHGEPGSGGQVDGAERPHPVHPVEIPRCPPGGHVLVRLGEEVDCVRGGVDDWCSCLMLAVIKVLIK